MKESHHNRFFVQKSLVSGNDFTIISAEFNHLLVKRLKPGETVFALDGEGSEYKGKIREISLKSADCEILEKKFFPPPQVKFVLAIGIVKPGPLSFAVEKAVELGAWQIIPLILDRSSRPLHDAELGRLQRIAVSAMKQSGGYYLPAIEKPQKLDVMLSVRPSGSKLIYAHPSGKPLSGYEEQSQCIYSIIGPEGDFSPGEIDLLNSSGAIPVSLGNRRLRTETAALALLVCLQLKSSEFI